MRGPAKSLGKIGSAVLTFIGNKQENKLTDTHKAKCIYTWLLGRFAPIFLFNCEQVLIENIEKQRKNNFADFQDFKIFYKCKKNF